MDETQTIKKSPAHSERFALPQRSFVRGSAKLVSTSTVTAALSLLVLLSQGCTRTPYPAGYPVPGQYPTAAAGAQPNPAFQAGVQPPVGPASVYAGQQTSPQLVELKKRVQQLDETNRQLTTQVAQAQQQVQAFRERTDLLAKQLRDASEQNRQLLANTSQYANESLGMQASMRRMQESMRLRGGARLTANNSLSNSSQALNSGLQIAGAAVEADGDAIRIRIPADQLFSPGTAQLMPSASVVLDQVSNALLRNYSRRRVAIEGHTDAALPTPGAASSVYQIASSQAQAALDYLVRRGGVPSQQLFIVAHGPNYPRGNNQSPAGRAENRRLEIVVYPETF
ncbi:MAG: flagellar motor protein MotB [Pirellulaceae bacterium]